MSFPINYDIISTVESQPAKVLDLMVTNSLLSKIQFKQFPEMQNEIANLTKILTTVSTESSKPDLIHTDIKHRELALTYIQKVINKLTDCRDQIEFSTFSSIYSNLSKLKNSFILSTTTEKDTYFNVEPRVLLEQYGVNGMLDSGLQQAKLDFKKFEYRDYSEFEARLNKNKVNKEFSERLFRFVAKDLMGYNFNNNINFTEQKNPYDLSWCVDKNGISYISPILLDFANFLSFEIPHNITHLIHLDKLDEQNHTTYIDSMSQRAFFEGVAIYAERLFSGIVNIDKLYDFLSLELKIDSAEIKEWFEYVRSKENALRSVRLVSDVETMNGLGYSQVIKKMRDEISNISDDKLHSETSIYYQFTGLSSCYTPGGVKLIGDNANKPLEFFQKLNPKSNSWREYNLKNQND
jgi:hypothetical protein